jgi:ArsR family metal-binding transcriptional regulator
MGGQNAEESRRTEKLIADYELEMCPPACVPGSASWSARAVLKADIDAVLPYLNARLEGADYDHGGKTLIWKDRDHKFAFRPRELKAAPAEDREQAVALIERAVTLINETWSNRGSIEPRYEGRTLPNLMQVYRLLPRTNCGRCGCATCMAFAAAVREGEKSPELCPVLEEADNAEHRRLLLELLCPPATP